MSRQATLDHLVFGHSGGMRVIAGSVYDTAQRDAWERRLDGFVRLEPFQGTRPAWGLSYVGLDAGRTAVIYRFDDGSGSVGRIRAHALIGPSDLLTPTVAMGLYRWSRWQMSVQVGEWLPPVPYHVIKEESDRVGEDLARQAMRCDAYLIPVLATISDRPNDRIMVLGCPDDDTVPLLWGVHHIADRLFAKGGLRTQDWTFSTYESSSQDVEGAPRIVFLPGRPDTATSRASVNLRRFGTAASVSPESAASARRLVEDFVTGLDPEHRSPPPAAIGESGATPPDWYLGVGRRARLRWDGRQWTGERWEPPSGVFVSYCRSDEEAVRRLVDDLRAARLTVWLDQELETGEVWWEEILHRIRDSAVVVHALSEDALRSEPCRAELAYAQALGIPVVPVLVADADLRSSQHGRKQVVDYRRPVRQKIARFVADVIGGATQRLPLPTPLPEPPEAPFGYVLKLTEELEARTIEAEDQRRLLHELLERLHDARDPTVRVAVLGLLRKLVNHPDAVHSVVVVGTRAVDDAGG